MQEGVEVPVLEQKVESDPLNGVLKHLEVAGGFTNEKEGIRDPTIPLVLLADTDIDSKYVTQLHEQGLIPQEQSETLEVLDNTDLERFTGNTLLLPRDSNKQVQKYFDGKFTILKPDSNLPQTIIIHIPDKFRLQFSYQYICKKLWADSMNLPPEQRPSIILHTDNFELPLQYRHDYEGFYYATSVDSLKNTLERLKKESEYKENKSFDPQKLTPGQKESYDASVDLREWEHITADTYQTLKNIIGRIKMRQELLKNRYSKLFNEDGSFHNPQQNLSIPINTILDIGTGEGRIAGMLARIPDLHVVGLDVSPEMIKRAKERVIQEGEGLRGEKHHPGLSYEAFNRLLAEDKLMREHGAQLLTEGQQLRLQGNNDEAKLKEEEGQELSKGILPSTSLRLDDQEVLDNYLLVEGSFFTLFEDLNKFMVDWKHGKVHPDIDQKEFFPNHNPGYAFTNEDNMFLDASFDMATITWNTICEIGDPKNQRAFIHNILRVLAPGGELYIEISNRDLDPHKSAIEDHHKIHPDEPFGTTQDKKPDGSGEYPRRYFADIHELAEWCRMNGCEVDMEKDIKSFKAGEDKDGADNVYALMVRKKKM